MVDLYPQGPVTLDGAGHTTAQAGFTYTWDGAGRLKTVSLSGTLLATYHYDARHRRTRKETTAAAPQGVATVLYAYDPDDHLLAETDAGGPIRSYLWRDDVPLAQIEHRPSRNVLYLETDHLNTPRAARNEAGTLVWRWEADAFGSSLPDQDPDGDGTPTVINLRFPGQYYDPESGLHYNQARYYDPTTGRYLSPDPVGLAGGINTYAYVGGNPLRYVDPEGLVFISPVPGIPDDTTETAPPIRTTLCERACYRSAVGLGVVGAGMVAAGQPVVPKRFVTPGSSPATSLASVAASKIFGDAKIPFRIPAPTAASPAAKSASLARITGRYIPIAGYGLLAYDIYDLVDCLSKCDDCNER